MDAPAQTTETATTKMQDDNKYIAVGIIKLITLYSEYAALIPLIPTVLCSNPTHVITWISVWERASINEWKHLSHNQVAALMRNCKMRLDRIPLKLTEDSDCLAIEPRHCRGADLIRVDHERQKLLKYRVQQNPSKQMAEIVCVEEIDFCDLK